MEDWLNINGKVYVVTGGSSGIGRAVVEELLADGAKVANFDISHSDLEHSNYLFVKTDVTSLDNVRASVKETVDKFGTVDGLVNNAGINIPSLLVDSKKAGGPFELNEVKFDKMMSINIKGLFFVSQEVGRILVGKKQESLLIWLPRQDLKVVKDKASTQPQRVQYIH